MIKKIIDEFKQLNEVDSVLLGGSRATNNYDDNSDYDFYVYLKKELPESKRREILEKYASYMEYSNHFWELEDDGVLNNGIEVEFIYRTIDDLDKSLENLCFKGNVNHGYSTCFLDNLLKSKILFDKGNKITKLRKKYKDSFSEDLKDRIILYNFPIINDLMPSLYFQIEKAIKRSDIHSIIHRVSAFFDIFYDVLYAINEETHPGEKRLLELGLKLSKKPKDMKEDIQAVFSNIFLNNEEMLRKLDEISCKLHMLLVEEGYVIPTNRMITKQS